jgi:hypothetical protein
MVRVSYPFCATGICKLFSVIRDVWLHALNTASVVAAIILLARETPDHSNRPHSIMTTAAVEALKGVLHYECRDIGTDGFADITFANLRPETNYVVYAVADSTHAKQVPITDEEKVPTLMSVTTQPEVLDIEWSRLSTEQQVVEIKAALRTTWLRDTAAAFYPPIILPVDDDIHLEEAAAGDHPEGSKSAKGGKDKEFGASPKVKGRKTSTATTAGPPVDEEKKAVWRHFLEWWVGQSPQTVTKIRAEFHLKEALFAVQQDLVSARYLESGLCKNAELDALVTYAASMEAALAAGKVRKDAFPTTPEFRKFRSWYKGGQVLRDLSDAALR